MDPIVILYMVPMVKLPSTTPNFAPSPRLHRPWVVNMSAEPDPDFSQDRGRGMVKDGG